MCEPRWRFRRVGKHEVEGVTVRRKKQIIVRGKLNGKQQDNGWRDGSGGGGGGVEEVVGV